jgi:hypothetical protein
MSGCQQTPAWREAARARLLLAQREQGFRFNRPPLMRMTLVHEEASPWTLVWTHHHLILDGWSTSILLDDFFALLSNPAQARPARAPFSAYLPSEPLARFSAAARVSVGTVLLGALALVLDRLARSDDVALGLVLSGRQAPIDGIGEMTGLLANSLPLHV